MFKFFHFVSLRGIFLIALLPVTNLSLTGEAGADVVPGTDESARWFVMDALNVGLDEPGQPLYRATPMDTMDTFIVLTNEEKYADAAHLLDLTQIDPEEQPERGKELAIRLREVMDRGMVIDWPSLPDRPDALQERGTGDEPQAGQIRRSIPVAQLDLESRPATIRLNRVMVGDEDPIWVFSAQSVRDIDHLYAEYGPGWFESRLPAALQETAPLGTRIWEWIVLPLLLIALMGLGWAARWLFGRIGSAVPVRWINRASERVRTPLSVALMAILAQVLVGWLFSFSGIITTILLPALLAVVIFGLTFAGLRTIDATLEAVTERFVGEIDDARSVDERKLYTSIYALRRFILLAAVLISGVLIISQLRLFEHFGVSLLASAGLATVILGIAGQTVLGNILASLQIAIAKPVRIGDAVLYEDRLCHVESIFYTFVILRGWDNRRLLVPVQHFISSPFENWSMVDATITRTFSLHLDHKAEPEVLRKAFLDLVEQEECALSEELLMTVVEGHHEWSQELRFYVTARSPSDAWKLNVRLREAMGDWIRKHHPEWWPSKRWLEVAKPDS